MVQTMQHIAMSARSAHTTVHCVQPALDKVSSTTVCYVFQPVSLDVVFAVAMQAMLEYAGPHAARLWAAERVMLPYF